MLNVAISIVSAQGPRGGGRIKKRPLALLATAEGTIEADNVTGELTITIASPPEHAGTYTQDVAGNPLSPTHLAEGPQALIAPAWEGGTPAIGEPQAFRRGIWIYDTLQGAPAISYDVLRNGTEVLVDDAAYSGAESYTPGPDDSGTDLTVVETATQGGNARSAASPPLPVPETRLLVSGFGQATKTASTSTGVYTEASPNFSAGDRVLVIVTSSSASSGTSTFHKIAGVSVAGEAASVMFDGSNYASVNQANLVRAAVFEVTLSGSGSGITVNITNTSDLPADLSAGLTIRWANVSADYEVVDVTTKSISVPTPPWNMALDVNTSVGGVVLSAMQVLGNHAVDFDTRTDNPPSGWSLQDIMSGENNIACLATDLSSAETPRVVRIGETTVQPIRVAGLAVALQKASA